MTRLWILWAVLAATPAAAGPQLAVSGELPCSRDELAAALDLRVGDVAIRVHGTGDRVRVEIDGRDRVVALDGARGTAAARRIALVAEDLALPELPDGAPEVRAPRQALARFSLSGRAASDAMPRGAMAAGTELGRGPVRLAIEAGVAGGVADEAWLLGVPVRVGVALGDDPAIRVGAVVMPFEVHGGIGDRGVLIGGSVEARGRKRAGGVDVIYLFGIDVFANQVEYRWNNQPAFTTPRVEMWGGVGVAWGAR